MKKRLLSLCLAVLMVCSAAVTCASASGPLTAARTAIEQAMNDYEVTEQTTLDDLLAAARAVVGSDIEVEVDDLLYAIVPATDRASGTLAVGFYLFRGSDELQFRVVRTLPCKVQTVEPDADTSARLDEVRTAMIRAMEAKPFTNHTTKAELLAAAQSAAKYGAEVEITYFGKDLATFEDAGKLTAWFTVTINGFCRESLADGTIAMLERKLPSGVSDNKAEWDIIRLTNVERVKEGKIPLTMVTPLQQACDIRASELVQRFEHTRPDGSLCFTAIPSSFAATTAGENIYQCSTSDVTGKQAVNAWMHSEGHRNNMLKASYHYMGAGTYKGEALQLFAAAYGDTIVSWKTGSGATAFADEDELQKEYLICTSSNGMVSYLPLDVKCMTKSGGTYTMKLNGVTVKLTVTSEISFEDVTASSYCHDAVYWAVEKGITKGTSSTTFSPASGCNRAQIITFLHRAAGEPKAAELKNWFVDVKRENYYYDAALWAREMNMFGEGDEGWGFFRPDEPCIRKYAVYFIWMAFGCPKPSKQAVFSDVDPNGGCADFMDAISWAVEQGITTGIGGGKFGPDDGCTRGQIVTFLYRAYKAA